MHPRELQKLYDGIQFDFSTALNLIKVGFKIYRSGWNGKGMWLTLQMGHPDGAPITDDTAKATGIEQGTFVKYLPYIMIKTADMETTFVPWQPSMPDLLGDDWMVIFD